jgi:hypothetical protein
MTIMRAGALGAFAVAAGATLAYALFVWWTVPGPSTGMDLTLTVLAWISIGGVIGVIVAVHIVYARVLLREDAVQRERGAARS